MNPLKKSYAKMSRQELVEEGRRRGVNSRLLTMKFAEGAPERDRIEIIKQLNELDQQERSMLSLRLSILAIVISLVSVFTTALSYTNITGGS